MRHAPCRNSQYGGAAPATLAVILLLLAMVAAATIVIGSATRPIRRVADLALDRQLALGALGDTLKAIERWASDGIDCREEILAVPEGEGFKIRVDDVSSRLNPNLIRKNLVEKTALAGFLMPGASVEILQQRREDDGLSLDIFAGYGDLFDPEILERLFTPYSYGSVNTDDEFALRRLFYEATGDRAASEAFHASLQGQLSSLEILTAERIQERYGTGLLPVQPLIGAEPQINANFALADTLDIVLSYPAFGVSDHHAIAETLVAAAASGRLDAQRIQAIIGKPAGNPVYAWIGSRTWFWRVVVETDLALWRAIVRMEPGGIREGPRAVLCEFGRTGEDDDRMRRYE